MAIQEALTQIIESSCTHLPKELQQTTQEKLLKECLAFFTKKEKQQELYAYVNEEMHQGLKQIFQAISSAGSAEDGALDSTNAVKTKALFDDTAQQLSEVMETLLKATETIMNLSEELIENHEEALVLIEDAEDECQSSSLTELKQTTENNLNMLTEIITSLSFQDLTGQRLQKIIATLNLIQEDVFDLYISTGLMLKLGDNIEEKNLEELKEENQKTLSDLKEKKVTGSELKGPSSNSSQNDVDDLLASLGL